MILIVDDDKAIRLSLGLLLKRAGYEVDSADNPNEALNKVRNRKYDLIFMDMNYSRSTTGEEGIELLCKTKTLNPETPVILITAWGSIDLAVEGMRHGAYDFITKPWNNLLLLQRTDTAIKLNARGKEVFSQFDRAGIIGKSESLNELLATVERIAPTDAPVLILGENGTGKEMIANAIHINSRRRNNPFVMVNLGGIPQSLFESEMFGHVKGAFTGAMSSRTGRFELADTGTIFLDEIGELDMTCQVKMLRVLQQHTFEPVGDSIPRKVDIRVISATNADLNAMVNDRSFREDLFFRINLITLHLPALRERRGDIPLLVNHFITQTAKNQNISVPEIESEAMEYLTRLPYPGNIRQLKNMVERAVLIGGNRLNKGIFESIPGMAKEIHNKPSGTLNDLEKTAVIDALEKSNGNMSKAARILGISRQTLYRRMEKYKI